MALEDRFAQHDKVIVDKFNDPSGNYQMMTYDYVLRPSTSAAITITLPPVAEAKGRIYSIIARAIAGGGSITVTHKGDSECWAGNIVLDAKCEGVVLYSDGLSWIVLGTNSVVAPTQAPSS